MNDLRELYQEVILDHGKRPRNLEVLEDADRTAEGFNPQPPFRKRPERALGLIFQQAAAPADAGGLEQELRSRGGDGCGGFGRHVRFVWLMRSWPRGRGLSAPGP